MAPIILPYKGKWPKIDPSAFIAPGAVIVGDVEIGPEVGVWFGCVIRGDVQSIRIGARTNIQDGTVIHVTRVTGPTTIGAGVTIGHRALLHACTLEDGCFIGMGATILDQARVQTGGMLAAGAVLAPGKIVPYGELWAGNPAKLMRPMRQEEIDFIPISEQNYVKHVHEYRELGPIPAVMQT
jgi:carbonic anhydrase/acetyltransferase-like protein (isoleucine patch superfamily)